MKKTLLVLLLLFVSFGLYGCEKKEEEIDDAFIIDIPDETFVNLNELPYIDYLSLLNPEVTITVKDMGEIVIQLFPEVAPNTVNNFIAYIQNGDYTDNEFHRVVVDFMIQGGKLDDPACTIEGEMTSNLFVNTLMHYRGVISMARVGGDYNSQSSQFFIMHKKASFLDSEYAAFGGVTSGFNILDYIAELEEYVISDGSQKGLEIPVIPVYIESITVDTKGITYSSPICLD